jgi:transcriptional regulator with XRE-family HTH domain
MNISDQKKLLKLYCRELLATDATELVSMLAVRQKMSRSDLAERAGKSRSGLSNVLSGSHNMTLSTLSDLCFTLGYAVKLSAVPLREVKKIKQENYD